MRVLFASKCWEKDWLPLVSGGFQKKVDAIGYPFAGHVLILNNGVPVGISPIIDGIAYHRAIKRDWDFLGVREPNVYCSGELSAVAYAAYGGFDYICYLQGDCITENGDWVTPAILILEEEPDVTLVSPASEVNTWADKDGYDSYVSDQAFVARVSDLSSHSAWNVPGNDPDYPQYALDSFEARLGRHLKAMRLRRKILEGYWCYHNG